MHIQKNNLRLISKKNTSCMLSNLFKLSNGSRFISKHAKIILLVAFSLKNRNLLLLYIHTKKPNDYDSNFLLLFTVKLPIKKEYLSICARNWSLNMHSHKIDSLHFISTYTLNSRGDGNIWDFWDTYVPQMLTGTFGAISCFENGSFF